MALDKLLLAIFLWVGIIFNTHLNLQAQELIIYDADEFGTYFYKLKAMTGLPQNVVDVWTKIAVKTGMATGLQLYALPCSCGGLELAKLKEIQCMMQIDCPNERYRITEGALKDQETICICEPNPERITTWKDVPPESSIEKLL